MKINCNYIKAFVLVGLTFFLFAFAKTRNETRKLTEVNLYFTNSENLYVTEEAVNKLLIQNDVRVQSIGKETLDLNGVEAVLDTHNMIENAEVFVSIDGKLGATITQRKPLARILDDSSYYLDRQGLKMPLSEYHSARVPLVTGVSEKELKEVFPVVEFIKGDEFLAHHITSIHRDGNGFYELQLRELEFKVFFGTPIDIERKFNNFKAFYQKAMKDKKLDTFTKVDLQFGNQVVCTKK